MRKTQIGTVVSDKMQNTAIVEVQVWKTHLILDKRYKRHAKFMAHNAENQYKIGDLVEIAETKPLSRNKHWEITKKIENKGIVRKVVRKSVKRVIKKKK